MKRLILATGNAHKAEEFARMFTQAGLPCEVASARSVGGMPKVEEITGTFSGNARLKANALKVHAPPGTWVLADDSGLSCDALDGAPGVDSAIYAGPQATDADNRAKSSCLSNLLCVARELAVNTITQTPRPSKNPAERESTSNSQFKSLS